ncbi:hypothetical protein HHI36_021731 [Cryptolaemus montrouzieri]|uniref:THAP-type domain-containing protein n=1 Tax=Cryptolaemus montrouzieri TaxID=559131 RepID=A0ABD2MYF1_9CUCU
MEDCLSSRRNKKCCVPNCENKHSKRHRFPKSEPEIFEAWLRIIQPKGFEELTRETIYNRYYVCDVHFSNKWSLPGSKRGLVKDALPTLLIPGEICKLLLEINKINNLK